MSTQIRPLPELIAAAQKDGWHKDPLGQEIIVELGSRSKPLLTKASMILIAGLLVASGLAVSVSVNLKLQNSRLQEKIVAAATLETGRAEQLAAYAKNYDDLRNAFDTTGKAQNTATTAIIASLNDHITLMSKEGESLKAELNSLKAEIAALKTPTAPEQKLAAESPASLAK